MAACWKCGAEAGIDKAVCSDCSDPISGDVPQVTQGEPSFGGQFLRFVGTAMIIVAVILGLFGFLGEWQLIFFALVIGLAGAALHSKGRKLAPDKGGASVLGGCSAGTVILIWVLISVAAALESCADFFYLR